MIYFTYDTHPIYNHTLSIMNNINCHERRLGKSKEGVGGSYLVSLRLNILKRQLPKKLWDGYGAANLNEIWLNYIYSLHLLYSKCSADMSLI